MNQMIKVIKDEIVLELTKESEKAIKAQVRDFELMLRKKAQAAVMAAANSLKITVQDVTPNTISPIIRIEVTL